MNTLSKICTVLMLAGATSLMAAEGDTDKPTAPARGDKGGPGMRERGPRGGHHGPRGNFTVMECPNCHHRLIVLSPDGHGGRGPRGEGREGREGRERGGRPGRRGPGRKGGAQKPQPPATTPENSEK